MRFALSLYLHCEQLEHRLLAGSYVGFQFGNLTPSTGLPYSERDPRGLPLVNPGRTIGGSSISLPLHGAANAVTQTIINGVTGAFSNGAGEAGPSTLNLDLGNLKSTDSDFFRILDKHPLFQKNPLPSLDDIAPTEPSKIHASPFRGYIFNEPPHRAKPEELPPSGGGGIPSVGAVPYIPIINAPPVQPAPGGDIFRRDLWVANAIPFENSRLNIPVEHARIWWTPERLQVARQLYEQVGLQVNWSDAWSTAFAYVVTQDASYARAAIDILMNFTISESELQGVASDTYRWSDWVPVVYDWTYNAMTTDERQGFMDRYNYYAETIMTHSWGGLGMEGNNYFWGYFRNELNWSIATYYENPMAQTFMDHALLRWESFLNFAADGGQGGVAVDGSEYGRAMLAYPMVPLQTMDSLGRDMFDETNFYKEAIFNMIYSTSPAPTYRKDDPTPYYQVFPFRDDEHDGGYPSALSYYYGDFMTTVADKWRDLPVGQYAQTWLNMVQPDTSIYNSYFNQSYAGSSVSFDNLPLDYYAQGPGYLYSRNQWGSSATNIFFQLGQVSGVPLTHLDAGTFQIWRNGYYLSKESTGYDLYFNGGMSQETISKNGLLINGLGQVRAWQDYSPQVLRVQSSPDFTYAAVDLTGTYRSHSHASLDNPSAGQVIREFFYIKPLDTMFILDRMSSTDEEMPASQVEKTFLLHTPYEPWSDGPNSFMSQNGDQVLRLTSLGQTPQFRVVNEGDFEGYHDASSFYQYRLEASLSGQAQSYFLNVLQFRDTHTTNVVSHMTEDANTWTITLDHPTLGHAKIVLNKGMDSVGGALGFSLTGTPNNLVPLLDRIQGFRVTDYGPVWEVL